MLLIFCNYSVKHPIRLVALSATAIALLMAPRPPQGGYPPQGYPFQAFAVGSPSLSAITIVPYKK